MFEFQCFHFDSLLILNHTMLFACDAVLFHLPRLFVFEWSSVAVLWVCVSLALTFVSLSEFVAVGRSCMACQFVVGVGNLGFVSAENPLLGAIRIV